LYLQNFLSYGDEGQSIELKPLNVLIGPNASGKSNLIEAISLLRALPTDLTTRIREGGGISDWLWKGQSSTPVATVEAIIDYPNEIPLRNRISFTVSNQRLEIVDEVIEDEKKRDASKHDVKFYYRYQGGRPVLSVATQTSSDQGFPRTERRLRREDLSPEQSVLSQRKDPDQYPELTYLNMQYSRIQLYREWNLGRNTPPRMPQKPDDPVDFLLEDGRNLGLVLNSLQHFSDTEELILTYLRKFYETAKSYSVRIQGGTVQLFIHETGPGQPIIPATRLSDGTIRYLSLLGILCHPNPPPVICIEEPELGLHPDIMPVIAELLFESSKRAQLIVTTHSTELVSALEQTPESIIVCERDHRGTYLRRLESEKLRAWLQNYSLGELWHKGEIGGTRW
jgi:predicted ATPase